MEQKFNDFYNQTNGKYIETEDSSNYAQCMDLAFKWCDTLGIPRDTIRHLYAYQAWTNPLDITRQYFDLIPNGATNVAPVGSLAVFGQSVGFAGHISVVAKGSNSKDLISEDQNWGSPKYSRLVTHYNYSGVLGWLSPKSQSLTDAQKLEKIKGIAFSTIPVDDRISQIKAIYG